MSKVLFSYRRNGASQIIQRVQGDLDQMLCPDNLTPEPSIYRNQDHKELYIFNPHPAIKSHELSVCMGRTIDKDWFEVGTTVETGNYGIIRSNEEKVELVADLTASRTIWWYHDDDVFLASTSQRALLYCIPGFELNQQAISWMLMVGYQGPSNAWDTRLKSLDIGETLTLDIQTWKISRSKEKTEFKAVRKKEKELKNELRGLLVQSVKDFVSDKGTYLIPLSGGYDSRGILCILNGLVDKSRIHTLTWGVEANRERELSDNWVAQKLAEHYDVQHEYLSSSVDELSCKTKMDRFLVCSEGRCDAIHGYWDGMFIWSTLFKRKYVGILRGEQPFGSPVARSKKMAIKLAGISTRTIDPAMERWNCEPIDLSEITRSEANESAPTLRDRLYQEHRIPGALSALSDIKYTYVEVEKPYLDNRIIRFIRTLADQYRTDRKLYKSVLAELSPDIPYAKYNAITSFKNMLSNPDTLNCISQSLERVRHHPMLSPKMISDAKRWISSIKNVDTKSKKRSFREIIRPLIPQFVKEIRYNLFKKNVSRIMLLLRIWIIVEMTHLLQDDLDAKAKYFKD